MGSYAASKLATALLSPLGTALLLGLVGVLLTARMRRTGTTLVVLALAWLWLWSTPAASDRLQQHLEGTFPPRRVESLPRADAIVVLGGAMVPPSATLPYPDLNMAADRVWHAARVYRAGKAPLIVASGGSEPDVSAMPEAEAMAGFLAELGVPPTAILREGRSRNTRENAEFTAALLRGRQVRSVLLVTSALHMRRAAAEFERAGFQVVPAATDHSLAKVGGLRRWLPDTGALDTSARGLKEVVGSLIR